MVADSLRRKSSGPGQVVGPAWTTRRRDDHVSNSHARIRRRLLERDAVIDELTGTIEHLGRTSSRIVLIEGIHGSGRTAVLNTACRISADMGIGVVRAHTAGPDHPGGFGIAEQVLTQLTATDRSTAEHRHLDPSTRSDAELRALRERSLECLVRRACLQQLLVAVDDVDHADEASVEWLRDAADVAAPHGALFAVTALPPSRRLIRHTLDPIRIDGTTRRIPLIPLSIDAVTELVSCRFGDDAAHSDLPARCHRMTRGNPSLVFALFAWLEDRHAGVDDLADATALAAPVPIVRAITHRAYTTGPHVAEVLGAIALLDGVASAADIAAVTGRLPGEIDDIVDRFADSGDLEIDEPLRFVHPIVRSSVSAALTQNERRRVHERFATFLDERGESDVRVAHHLLASPPARNARWVEVLVSAGGRHADDGDRDLAESMLQRAIAESVDPTEHPDLALSIAALRARLGHRDAVDALALHGPDTTDIQGLTTHAYTIATRLDGVGSEVSDVLERVRDRVAGDDPDGAARLALCRSLLETDEPPVLLDGPDPVEEHCLPDTRALVAAHRLNRRVQTVAGGTAAEIGPELAATVTAGMLVSTDPVERHVAAQSVQSLLAADLVDAADELVTAAIARDPEEPTVRAGLSALAVQVAFRRGDLTDALAFLQVALSDSSRPVFAVSDVDAPTSVHLLWSQGRIDEAERLLQLSLGPADRFVAPSHLTHEARAWLTFHLGDLEAALRQFLQAGVAADRRGIRNPALTGWRIGAARVAAALGDHRQAIGHGEAAVHLARRFGAATSLARALAALARALPEQRVELLRSALELAGDATAPGLEAQIALELGQALRRQEATEEAIRTLRLAGDLSHRIGAPRLGERIVTELRAAGARPTHLALSGAASLTPAQVRIARLAIQGFTNVQIAEQLFISVKTVESHLARTYAKLGVHSRVELPEALAGFDIGDDLTDTGASTGPRSDACGSR